MWALQLSGGMKEALSMHIVHTPSTAASSSQASLIFLWYFKNLKNRYDQRQE